MLFSRTLQTNTPESDYRICVLKVRGRFLYFLYTGCCKIISVEHVFLFFFCTKRVAFAPQTNSCCFPGPFKPTPPNRTIAPAVFQDPSNQHPRIGLQDLRTKSSRAVPVLFVHRVLQNNFS